MKILILTTAINRPELHAYTFKEYRKFLRLGYDITWLVNIDMVEGLSHDVNITRRNIKQNFDEHPNIKWVFRKNEKGWYNKAVRTLMELAKEYVDDVDCVIYLEDDWELMDDPPEIEMFLKKHVGDDFVDKDFIMALSERIFLTGEYINFQPQLWSKSMFKNLIRTFDEIPTDNMSPELIAQHNFRTYKSTRGAVLKKFKIFRDAGREFMQRKGLRKRHKMSSNYAAEGKTYIKKGPKMESKIKHRYKSYREYVDKCSLKDTGWNVSDFTMDVNGKQVGVELPDNYDSLVKRIYDFQSKQIETGECKDGLNGILTMVNHPLACDEILELGEHFGRELSEKLYGGQCFVTYVHPYRNNVVDRRKVKESASWLWHYDDVVHGLVKILVYLNDTDRTNGAFLALKKGEDEYILKPPSKVAPGRGVNTKFGDTRFTRRQLRREYPDFEDYYVEGDAGTFILFNNNILHKATVAERDPGRMCVIYHFRPYNQSLPYHIHPEITGDWRGGSNVKSKAYAYNGL